MHDGFKVNESIFIAKLEQHYVIGIIKRFENEPKSWWSGKKIFYYFMFYSILFLFHCRPSPTLVGFPLTHKQ